MTAHSSDPAQPFAPLPVDPRGEYGVLPPEDVNDPPRLNLGDGSHAGLPYDPASGEPPPPDPREQQFSLLQILGLMAAAAVTLGIARRFVTVEHPAVLAAVIGMALVVALGVQVVFQPPWKLFKLTVWWLVGTYVAFVGLALWW